MNVSRRTLVKAALAGTVLTAGCGGNGTDTEPGEAPGVGEETETTEDETPGAGGEDTPEETEESTDPGEDTETEDGTGTDTSAESAATVQVGSSPDIGEILVGPEEMTLYMLDEDSQGSEMSACGEDCTGNWPPLTVEEGEPEAGEDVAAELSDGSMQVTANGWPLYQFADDEEPGDANGQAANDVWWVLDPEGSPVLSSGSSTATETMGGNETATPTESP